MGAEASAPRFNAGEFAGTYQGALSSKYEILKQLGSGAQGAAYLVRTKDGSSEYVAKETHDMTPEGKEDFKLEFEKMRDMRHPNCTKIIELVEGKDFINGEWKEQIFVISELARGSDMYKYMRRAAQCSVKLTEEWVAGVYRQAMEGVAYIHSRGIVHNDLKPDNILMLDAFDPQNPLHVPTVVINDFGCATLVSDKSFRCGDLRYQSPESWRVLQHAMSGGDISGYRKLTDKADVWSMGATLFELLSGGLIPFVYRPCSMDDICNTEGLMDELRDAVLQKDAVVGSYCTGISEEAEDLLHQVFEKQPEKRPSAAQVLGHRWFQIKDKPIDAEIQWKLEFKTTKCVAHAILLNALSSKVQRTHYQECFDAFKEADSDRSGTIDLEEFKTACTRIGRSDSVAESLFQQADIDGDHAVDFNEFMAVTLDWQALEPKALFQMVHQLFVDIDKDGSGEVDQKELSSLFQGTLDQEEVESVFRRIDADRNGRISLQELQHFLFEPANEHDVDSFVMTRKQSLLNRSRGRLSEEEEKEEAAAAAPPREGTGGDREAERFFGQVVPAAICLCVCAHGLWKFF